MWWNHAHLKLQCLGHNSQVALVSGPETARLSSRPKRIPMTLHINGLTRVIDNVANVAEVVVLLELPAEVLLVEHNGVALRRNEWLETSVKDGDTLELMQIAAGG